jgi:hypothetical protein
VVDGFNVTFQTDVNNNLNALFYSLDVPMERYTLSLRWVFEAALVNGKLVPAGAPVVMTAYNVFPMMQMDKFSINVTIHYMPTNNLNVNMQDMQFNYVYWFRNSTRNVCPDVNIGRFCVKTTEHFRYNNHIQNSVMVFVWNLVDSSGVVPTTSIPVGISNLAINNLGFYSVENTANMLVNNMGNKQVVPLPVTMEFRFDNVTTNGMWVIYNNLGAVTKYDVTHDPVFGVNFQAPAVTIQIVTIAISVTVVLALVIVVSCSVYMYHTNSRDYYKKIRLLQ